MQTFSVWASPEEGRLHQQLKHEIDALSAAHSTPSFQPHVTLVGGVECSEDEMLERVRSVATNLQPYFIAFNAVDVGTTYWQSVYLRCADDAAVINAARSVRSAVGQDESAPYMPHLSLLYIDAPYSSKQQIASQVVKRLYGERASYDTLLIDTGFWVKQLHVWCTPPNDPSLSSWRFVASFDLSTNHLEQ